MSYQNMGEVSSDGGHRDTGNSKIIGKPLAMGLILVYIFSFIMFLISMNDYRKLISGRCEAPILNAHDKFRFASCPGFFEQDLSDAPLKFFILTVVTLIFSVIALGVTLEKTNSLSVLGVIALGCSAAVVITTVITASLGYTGAKDDSSVQPLISWSQDRYGVTMTKTEAKSLLVNTVESGTSVMSEGRKFKVGDGERGVKFLALKKINSHEYELIDLKNLEEVPVVGVEKTDAANKTETAKE